MPGEITQQHCERDAYIYVRQSSQRQVEEHQSSREVQYNLVHRAKALGWSNKQIKVIDEDLGVTATGSKERTGFEKLLSNICLGNIGAIFILYASRLARNGREWHQTLELCSLFNVLIIDRDTIYDPRLPNDRLWLGMQGSFSEYEVKQMQLRAREAIMQKASKGEFIKLLPAGLVATDDNRIELDPDQRIQQAIRGVFKRFVEFGSVRQLSIYYQQNKIELPVRDGNSKGFPLVWRIPVYSTIHRMLTNPFYAGIYQYPRTKTKTRIVDGKVKKTRGYRTSSEDKVVLLEDLFISYISKDEYYRNQKMISTNANMYGKNVSGAPRLGQGLLAGLLRCGHCSRKLCVRYRSGQSSPHYFCRGARALNSSKGCLSFNGSRLDELISNEMLKVLQPHAIDAARLADAKYHESLKDKRDTLSYTLQQARYEANRYERQFNAVDPENHLVSHTLAHRWQESLEKVDQLEQDYQKLLSEQQTLSEQERARLYELADDLSQVWHDPQSDNSIKTRLVRLLVKEIWVKILDARKLHVTVHWQGGIHTQYELSRLRRQPAKSKDNNRFNLSPKQLIKKLAQICDDNHIVRILNRVGYVIKGIDMNGRWTAAKISELRTKYGIAKFSKDEYSKRGLVDLKTASEKLGVSMGTVLVMINRGIIKANQVIQHAPWEIPKSELTKTEVKHYISTAKRGRPCSQHRDQLILNLNEKRDD
jgi:DNA invertase Pin-like site-specific DNA recombinase